MEAIGISRDCPGINGVVGREMVKSAIWRGFESRGVPAFLETTGADGELGSDSSMVRAVDS